MGRGKIEIKLIESPTNRQVTYSKRRNGIFKKAHELSVLCDAKVSLIMFSQNNKMHEYITPGLTTKKMIDQYQKTLGNVDLWRAHHERMLENLTKLKEINNKLRGQIRNRIGADLDNLNFEQLRSLEEDIVSSSAMIHERKLHVIKTRTDTCKKKVKNLEKVNETLLLENKEKCMIYPQYLMHEEEDDEESVAVAVANGAPNLSEFFDHHNHLNLQHHHHHHYHHHSLRLA